MAGDKQPANDDAWRAVMLGTHPGWALGRQFFRLIPSEPRCKFCAAPLGGAGAPFMRLVGKGPWPKNPSYCSACFKYLEQRPGGAEIEASFLFADVRGSTPLGEQLRPTEIRGLMNRFYRTAAQILVEHDAIVDKFVGDEVIGIFVPALAGERHAARAIAAARAILEALGGKDGEAWLPVGAGVHSGNAYVGTVGEGAHLELTALGDVVNVCARLASVAGAGEVLVSQAAAQAAELDDSGLERRELELKGKTESTSVVVIPAGRRVAA